MGTIHDEWALDLYRDYLKLLARLHMGPRLLASLEDSDIAQQTILEAHKGRAGYRGATEAELLAWLRTILANVLAGAGRRLAAAARDPAREQVLEVELEEEASRIERALASDQTSPSGRAIRAESLLRLAHALAALPEGQRRVIELHHLQGLPLADVANLIGRTRPAVAGLLFRGLGQLRELLSDRAEGQL